MVEGDPREQTGVDGLERLSDRKFGIAFGILLLVIGSVAWHLRGEFPLWAALGATLFLTAAAFCPVVLLPLNCVWAALARRIMKGTNALVLGIFYFGVVTPLAVVFRVMRRDVLGRRFDPGLASYLQPVQRQTNRETLKDMF